MIRRHGQLLRASLAMLDGLAAAVLIAFISLIRFGEGWQATWSQIFVEPWAPSLLVTAGWILILWTQGLYRLRTRWSFGAQAWAVGRALGLMALVTFATLAVLKLPDVSRLFVLLLLPSMALSSLLLRAAIHIYVTQLRRHGRNTRNVLIVGSGSSAIRYAREIEERTSLGLRVIGYLDGHNGQPSLGVPYLGAYSDLGDVLHREVVDEVAICLDLAEWQLMENVTELCRAEGKAVRIPIAGALLSGSQAYIEDLSGMPVLSLLDRPDRQVGLAVKRLLDIATSSVALTIGLPLWLLIGLAVAINDGRPILFRQERVGLHGRRFRLVKFRTMVRDAEERLPELQHLNEIKGSAFKVTHDPRTTRVGRFLRRTSLDELPQLWNVLMGEMSIVGPRPPLPSEVHNYDPWHRRRLSMKPGITGLWQIEARREANFDRWVERDLEYIDRWSLWLDAKIALRTVPAILRSEGR